MVIDDDRDSADSMALLLQLLNHEVTTAYSGLSALEKAKDWQPHVILLDIGMPTMNGYEVAKHLREQASTAIIIAQSGFGQEKDVALAKTMGIDHYLVKPLEIGQLQALFATVRSHSDISPEELVSQCLLNHPYAALRNVACELTEVALTLRGRVPTFHLKLVAQETAGRLCGDRRIDNQIRVAANLESTPCCAASRERVDQDQVRCEDLKEG